MMKITFCILQRKYIWEKYRCRKIYWNHTKKFYLKKETRNGKLPWFCLHWAREEKDFNEPKILIRQTADSIIGTIDDEFYYPLILSHTYLKIENNAKTTF